MRAILACGPVGHAQAAARCGGVPMNELERLEAMLRARPPFHSNEQRRAAYDAQGDIFPLAADVRVEPVATRGVPAEWTSTPAANADDVILYLHGGGYAWGSLKRSEEHTSELQ